MNGFQIGDIVQTQITGEERGKYMITGFGDKNNELVADLSSAKDTHVRRWQYLDRLELDVHGDLLVWGLCPNNPAFHVGECECHKTEAPVIDTKDYTTHEHADFRRFRESLGLSRREVQEGAGVSGSALWRIEQRDGGGTAVQRKMVWNFLLSFKEAHPSGKPKAAKKTSKSSATAVGAAWEKIVTEAIAEIDQQIAKATANKTSTKGLRAVKEILEGNAE